MPFLRFTLHVYAVIASTGHASTQAPQSVHFDLLIEYFSSPDSIASTGQVGSQAPQAMHSSEILCAIFSSFIARY